MDNLEPQDLDRTRAIDLAASRLWAPIPRPRPPRPKPQQSWSQLKPGQKLRSLGRIVVGSRVYEPGSEWQVVQVNSLGAVVQLTGSEPPVWFSLTERDREWRGRLFERIRATPRQRDPK